MSESDDDGPQLSKHTMAVLQEFLQEQADRENRERVVEPDKVYMFTPQENWQLSQFWYNEETSKRLATEALEVAGPSGRIVCVSCPTAYKSIRELKGENVRAYCLEYDDRFQVYGEDFLFYDYKEPLHLPEELKNSFDIVLVDPPFLSEECLCKTAITVRYLMKEKVILCTGAVMTELADRLLNAKPTNFIPKHRNGLQNEFRCFANYETLTLKN